MEPVIPEPEVLKILNHVVMAPKGILDHRMAPDVKAAINDHLASGRNRIALDLKDLRGFNSIGLGVVLAAISRARASGGDIVMCRPQPEVRKMLDMTGVSRIVDIREEPAEVGENTNDWEST